MKKNVDLAPDDLHRDLMLARPDEDENLPHLGVVGDTYTILLTGRDTAGRLCLIDMHIPPAEVHLPTGTTSRRPFFCSKANSRPPSAA